MVRTKEECLRAAAHVVLMAAIRIEQERLDREVAEGAAAAAVVQVPSNEAATPRLDLS